MELPKTDQELIDEWLASHKPTTLPDRNAAEIGNSTPGWRHEKAKKDEARKRAKAAPARPKVFGVGRAIISVVCPRCASRAGYNCTERGAFIWTFHPARKVALDASREAAAAIAGNVSPTSTVTPSIAPSTATRWLRKNDPTHSKIAKAAKRKKRRDKAEADKNPTVAADRLRAITRGKF